MQLFLIATMLTKLAWKFLSIPSKRWLSINLSLLLELIIDYESVFITYRNEIKSKGVQFPGWDATDTLKICGFVPQEHQD